MITRTRNAVNIWPGFVDALATLLLVFIFMLVVFILAQFHLSDALNRRNQALAELNTRVRTLTAELAQERQHGATLATQLTQANSRAAQFVLSANSLQTQLDQSQRHQQALQQRLSSTEQSRAQLQTALDDALTTGQADRETLQLRLRELASLKDDLAALQALRDDLEQQVSNLAAALAESRNATEQTRTDLDSQRQQAQAQIAELRTALHAEQQKRTTRDNDLAEREQSLSELTAQLAQTLDELNNLKTQLAQAQSQTQQAEQATQLRQTALDRALAENRVSKEQLELKLLDILTLKQDIAALQRIRTQLAEDVGNLRLQLDETRAAQSNAEQRGSTLENQLKEALARAELAEEKWRLQNQQLLDIAAQNDGTETALQETRRNLERLDRNNNRLRDQIALLSEQLQLTATDAATRTEEVAQLKTQLKRSGDEGTVSGYRSEFFTRLRQALGDQPDIRVVGDRFLFQSELLFDTASASLGNDGKIQLDRVAQTLKDISTKIPADVEWVLQVNGHTDKRPINTAQFPSNWELSSARAISIVRYLMEQGIPAERLAATGFAEYDPIDSSDTEEAYQRNRRIELKLTSR